METSLLIEYLNPFVIGASMVFNQLFNVDLRREKIEVREKVEFAEDVMIRINFSGTIRGEVFFGLSKSIIYYMAGIVEPDKTVPTVSSDYMDILGELSNLIIGNALGIMVVEVSALISQPMEVTEEDLTRINSDDLPIFVISLYCTIGQLKLYIRFG